MGQLRSNPVVSKAEKYHISMSLCIEKTSGEGSIKKKEYPKKEIPQKEGSVHLDHLNKLYTASMRFLHRNAIC